MQYTEGIADESGNLVFMKFCISSSLVNLNVLSVFKTTKTLLMLVFTFPTKLNPFVVGSTFPPLDGVEVSF